MATDTVRVGLPRFKNDPGSDTSPLENQLRKLICKMRIVEMIHVESSGGSNEIMSAKH